MHVDLELPGPWFLCVEKESSRHGPFDLPKHCFAIVLMGYCVHGLVHQPWTVGTVRDLSPSAYGLWLSCPLLAGKEPMDCCHRLQLLRLGRKERWKAKPSYSYQWIQVSAHRWPVAADKPGCQQQWILAPLDAAWLLPDTRGWANTWRKETDWHHLGEALLDFPTASNPAKVSKLQALQTFVSLAFLCYW